MHLCVPCLFSPGYLRRAAALPGVREVYGRRSKDWIGGGRSSYTLGRVSWARIGEVIDDCHANGLTFNYLLNASSLFGIEQTRAGQKKIRRTLDRLSDLRVDWITVSLPYLVRLIKSRYPHFKVKVGVFAQIDSAAKARRWEDLGADTLCVSAIACNRRPERLISIRQAVRCGLQLIVNAACLPDCPWEATHMDLLSQSSRSGDPLRGFCLDYCFLQCSRARASDPATLLKAVWIRPEDLPRYEALGFTEFKLVERSCPPELLLRRIEAYSRRAFDGNLWELVAPVAFITRGLKAPIGARVKAALALARPWQARLASLRALSDYAERVIPRDFSPKAPVYIDNSELNGFIGRFFERECPSRGCDGCDHCAQWAKRAVRMDQAHADAVASLGDALDAGLYDGSHWMRGGVRSG